MDPYALSRAFVEHYYGLFDTKREAVAALYEASSMLTFEGQRVRGAEAIGAKLVGLPFGECKHLVATVDCQPTGPSGALVIFVSGNLQLPDEDHLLKFSEMFQLVPSAEMEGTYFIFNDIFRLNYA